MPDSSRALRAIPPADRGFRTTHSHHVFTGERYTIATPRDSVKHGEDDHLAATRQLHARFPITTGSKAQGVGLYYASMTPYQDLNTLIQQYGDGHDGGSDEHHQHQDNQVDHTFITWLNSIPHPSLHIISSLTDFWKPEHKHAVRGECLGHLSIVYTRRCIHA